MNNILMSQKYEIPDLPSLFGINFYQNDVGFGKVEERFTSDLTNATIVTLIDMGSHTVINTEITEICPEEIAREVIRAAIASWTEPLE